MNNIDKKIKQLEEKLNLIEKKKKKPYSSITFTSGDPDLNMKHFNKMMGTDKSSYMNGTIQPDPAKINAAAEEVAKAVGTFASQSPDGSNSVSTGDGGSSGGEGGGMAESLTLQESKRASWHVTDEDVIKTLINDNGIIKVNPMEMRTYLRLLRNIPSEKEQKNEPFNKTDVWNRAKKVINITKEAIDKLPENVVAVKIQNIINITNERVWKLSDMLRWAKAEAKQSYMGYPKDETLAKIQAAALFGALVKKYYESKILASKANMKRGNYKRLTGQLGAEETQEAKDWLEQHVVEIMFRVPLNDADVLLTNPADKREDKAAVAMEIEERWEDDKNKFFEAYPNAIEGEDFIYRKTSADHDEWHNLWYIGAKTTFDVVISEAPASVQTMINAAKRASYSKNSNEIKQLGMMLEDKAVDSVIFAKAILSLFDNDFSFYKNKQSIVSDNATLTPPDDTISNKGENDMNEKLNLKEAKRYVRRYYIRPQDIFCSNKAEIIKALIDIDNANCTVYTLNNLGDVKDVSKLTNDDIIYYYDEGILYDKNKVKIMDYDLYIKHEEKRDSINPDQVSEKKFNDVYDDRMTDKTVVEAVQLDEEKMFVGKLARQLNIPSTISDKGNLIANPELYVELPNEVKLVPQDTVMNALQAVQPGELFEAGYITVLYFYKELWNKCTVLKCSEFLGYTGIDWSDTSEEEKDNTEDAIKKRLDNAKDEIENDVQKTVEYNLTNKVVTQRVGNITNNNVGSILYYPALKAKPKTLYFIDLHDGHGYMETSKDMLERTLFKKLREIMSDKKTDADIRNNIRKALGIDDETKADKDIEAKIASSRYAKDTKLRPQVRALYVSQIYYLKTDTKTYGHSIAHGLSESHELALDFNNINAYGIDLDEALDDMTNICCICGEEFEGYGNNPEPYMSAENGERCCDGCNLKFVIPARLRQLER